MRRWVALALALGVGLGGVGPAFAQVGIFVTRPGVACADDPRLTVPVSGQTVCFDSTKNNFYKFSASAWTAITASGLSSPITAAQGGTNIDTSASTGVPSILGGTWSVAAQLSALRGGLGIDTSASTGVPSVSAGTWSVAATVSGTLGGTGINNGANTITLGNTLATVGNFALTLTTTATTNSTLPAGTKTLVATDVATLASLASVGTITTGTWSATAIAAANGGSGLANFPATGTSRVTYNSATQIQLGLGVIPLKVSGTWVPRPVTAAVTISNSGLAASTLYYVYAFDSAGTSTLELSTTTHATDATLGVEIKSGDATRTLVGMIRTEGSTPGQFVDSAAQRFTVSYFNRRSIAGSNAFTADRSTTSLTIVEVNSEIRCEFVTWADEAVSVAISGTVQAQNLHSFTGIGIDSTTIQQGVSVIGPNVGAPGESIGIQVYQAQTEGYHYATLLGMVDAGTATWTFADTNGGAAKTRLTVLIRG